MRNRFCASFRMAENAKRTPELTRKVKNCNVPRNKIKSAIFWQKSYRLEWYLIICHYLNLYVHCISFITKLFLLWKLTGAKSNFETMCLQERNRRSNYFFFSPPAHLCAVTCMTEISLIVTLNNQFTSLHRLWPSFVCRQDHGRWWIEKFLHIHNCSWNDISANFEKC